MAITYSSDRKVTGQQVADLYRSSGIRRPADDVDRIQRMLDGAALIVTAWDGDLLVGVARSLTDWCYACYLSDLAVAGEYQRRGIGRELIVRTQAAIGEETMLLLLAAPEANAYYPHIGVGFEHQERAWEIPRKR